MRIKSWLDDTLHAEFERCSTSTALLIIKPHLIFHACSFKFVYISFDKQNNLMIFIITYLVGQKLSWNLIQLWFFLVNFIQFMSIFYVQSTATAWMRCTYLLQLEIKRKLARNKLLHALLWMYKHVFNFCVCI
jgi:hypothetical protein